MLKVLVIVAFVSSILGCKWVCVDEKHRIVKEYIDSDQFKVDHQKHEIVVPQTNVKRQTKGKRLNNKISLPEAKIQMRMPEFAVEPAQGICQGKEFEASIKEIRRKVKCKPRETIVDIKYKGGKVFPDKISTKLCSGGCSGTKTCLSVERENISLAVSVLGPNSKNFQCSHVMIPQDTKCSCGCDKSVICPAEQVFDKRSCKCKCINEKAHHICVNKMKNYKVEWNKEKCLCQCKFERTCTTGSKWDKNQCKCMK